MAANYKVCRKNSEYDSAIMTLNRMKMEHLRHLEPGTPQFDWCDVAVMVCLVVDLFV